MLNGAVFLACVEWYRRNQRFLSPETVVWRMPPERSIDIDGEFDSMLSAAMLKSGKATRTTLGS